MKRQQHQNPPKPIIVLLDDTPCSSEAMERGKQRFLAILGEMADANTRGEAARQEPAQQAEAAS